MKSNYPPYPNAYPNESGCSCSDHTHNNDTNNLGTPPGTGMDQAGAPNMSYQQTPTNYYPKHDYNQYGVDQYGNPIYCDPYGNPLYLGERPPAVGFASWWNFQDSAYLKGFLIGAGVTLLLTNTGIQKAIVKGTVHAFSLVQGGIEEVKEQVQDVKAEMSQKK